MPVEKSAGAIIFSQNKEIEYLLLHYPSGSKTPGRDYWDFPKGHIEEGEEEAETVKREVEEETGLKDIMVIPEFKTSIKYFFRQEGKTIFKIVVFYLAKSKTKEVKISPEHIGYTWLPYKEAQELVIFKNAKDVLEKANQFLEFYGKQKPLL